MLNTTNIGYDANKDIFFQNSSTRFVFFIILHK